MSGYNVCKMGMSGSYVAQFVANILNVQKGEEDLFSILSKKEEMSQIIEIYGDNTRGAVQELINEGYVENQEEAMREISKYKERKNKQYTSEAKKSAPYVFSPNILSDDPNVDRTIRDKENPLNARIPDITNATVSGGAENEYASDGGGIMNESDIVNIEMIMSGDDLGKFFSDEIAKKGSRWSSSGNFDVMVFTHYVKDKNGKIEEEEVINPLTGARTTKKKTEIGVLSYNEHGYMGGGNEDYAAGTVISEIIKENAVVDAAKDMLSSVTNQDIEYALSEGVFKPILDQHGGEFIGFDQPVRSTPTRVIEDSDEKMVLDVTFTATPKVKFNAADEDDDDDRGGGGGAFNFNF